MVSVVTDSVDYWEIAERAQERVQAYFDARAAKHPNVPNQHYIDGIKQAISDVTLGLVTAARKGTPMDAAEYIAKRLHGIEQGQMRPIRKVESRLGLETLADELGIKDKMLKALEARQGGVSI